MGSHHGRNPNYFQMENEVKSFLSAYDEDYSIYVNQTAKTAREVRLEVLLQETRAYLSSVPQLIARIEAELK